ncbi:MAG: UDP-glucose/GDP-mannose dehydrogenase family protein [Bauldia sp.]|uniref:UDP-glucose dehydrogenase family protein n=1 Tax=Bauldia sp. TaxID=2575872 RepID=UPI001DCF130D|nr:UDP-glucose/GDP-mannose dehydrogenase family protein [Bauldia sp.]MCB1498086.1 UDP-glucose/GDP-mannose dehydrogenase family protein [Bauldia sp.]
MKVSIIGAGYVGLVSGVCLAAKGHDVTCIDVNEEIVARLNGGEPHIFEEGLPALLGKVVAEGRFRASSDMAASMATADIVLIAVGTPSKDGAIDLQHIRSAAQEIGAWLKGASRFLSVVVKSTVVPGTTDTMVRGEIEAASGKRLGDAFGLGMNPEFLREGSAVVDFMEPDRIVIGFEDAETRRRLEELYRPWGCEKVCVNTRTAELIKYANNAILATQISAINEIANLAAALGDIDVMDVVKGVSLDRRWNPVVDGRRVEPAILSYLVPGCGFGGSCFPKDVQALRSQGQSFGMPMSMLQAVLDVNKDQPYQVREILEREVGSLKGKTCLVLGLAFKPGTDDVRESASLAIVRSLLDAGAKVLAHDPIAVSSFARALGGDPRPAFVDSWEDSVADADVIVVATKWPDYERLSVLPLHDKVLFDARRMFAADVPQSGRYASIGYRIGSEVDPTNA